MSDRLPGSLWRALWADVPLLNFAVYAVCIAHAEVVNLDPPRPDLFFTFVFPLLVPVVVYALRWPRANRLQRGVALGVVLGTMLLVGLSHWVAAHTPMEKEQLRSVYEVGAIANTLLLGVHAWTQGRAMLALFFGPAALYGMILENGGILAGFFSEMGYRLYLGPLPAPIATMSGWITVLYLGIQIAWQVRASEPLIRRSPFGSALVATAAALLLDLQIDPIATEIDLWRWDARLAAGPLGVPLLNFVAWVCAVFPFAWLLFLRQNAFELSPLGISARPHRRWLWTRVVSAVALATLLFCSGMALVEGGFDGPTFDIMGAAFSHAEEAEERPALTFDEVNTALAFIDTAMPLVGEEERESMEYTRGYLYLEAAKAAWLRRGEEAGDNADLLNNAAWECFLHGWHTAKAIEWAHKAVKLSDRAPHILDTLASLLFQSGAVDEAIELEGEAIGKAEDLDAKNEFEERLVKWKAIRALRANRK